jgi:hypothetical protein
VKRCLASQHCWQVGVKVRHNACWLFGPHKRCKQCQVASNYLVESAGAGYHGCHCFDGWLLSARSSHCGCSWADKAQPAAGQQLLRSLTKAMSLLIHYICKGFRVCHRPTIVTTFTTSLTCIQSRACICVARLIECLRNTKNHKMCTYGVFVLLWLAGVASLGEWQQRAFPARIRNCVYYTQA